MATSALTERSLRIFAMDRPELNTLVDGVRFSPEDIQEAQVMVVDYFNTSLPPLGVFYTVEDFPYRYLMMLGVWGHLLRGAAINQASNQFSYAAAGVQINDNDKAGVFSNLGNQYWAEFQRMTLELKMAKNVAQVFGTENSEYVLRNFK
jgi:hypothetical protein